MSESLVAKIARLKQERNAVILAHNYQVGEVQDIADYCGDSLGLSRKAADIDTDVIVFCGVFFMAETAAILSPDKTVLLPDLTAGCPMADMVTAAQLKLLKDQHPDAVVVTYVNSPADVKALSDVCCTSSNAVDVVQSVPQDRKILFVPDKYLGSYVMQQTGRDMILWPGYCPTHMRMDPDKLKEVKAAHPDAVVLAHPECNEQIRVLADEMLSTGQMLTYAKRSPAREFIIATEIGLLHTLRKENPDKQFYPISDRAVCPNMKKITLEKVVWSLEDMQHEVQVPEDVAVRARAAVNRMLDVLPKD